MNNSNFLSAVETLEYMTVEGAELVLTNGLGYSNVRQDESTEAYHYFLVDAPMAAGIIDYEVRVDRQVKEDGTFHIQSRSKGSEFWHYVDSVSSDWSKEEY